MITRSLPNGSETSICWYEVVILVTQVSPRCGERCDNYYGWCEQEISNHSCDELKAGSHYSWNDWCSCTCTRWSHDRLSSLFFVSQTIYRWISRNAWKKQSSFSYKYSLDAISSNNLYFEWMMMMRSRENESQNHHQKHISNMIGIVHQVSILNPNGSFPLLSILYSYV